MEPDNYYTCEKCGSTNMVSERTIRYCRDCFWHPKIHTGRPKESKVKIKLVYVEKEYPCMNCHKPTLGKKNRILCKTCKAEKERIRSQKRRKKKI